MTDEIKYIGSTGKLNGVDEMAMRIATHSLVPGDKMRYPPVKTFTHTVADFFSFDGCSFKTKRGHENEVLR